MFLLLGDGIPARGFDLWNLIFNTSPVIVLIVIVGAMAFALKRLWPGEDGEDY